MKSTQLSAKKKMAVARFLDGRVGMEATAKALGISRHALPRFMLDVFKRLVDSGAIKLDVINKL